MHITALEGGIGASVDGLDLNQAISAEDQRALVTAWQQYGLLLIPGACTTPEEQIRFSRLFGDLEEHPLKTIRSDEFPELMELNSEDTRTNPVSEWGGEKWIGRLGWHTDQIYSGNPNLGAVLRAVRLPTHDGQTGFSDQGAAYDALPARTREEIDGLEVVYRFEVNLYKMPYLDTSDYIAGPDAPDKPSDVGFPDFPDSIYPLVLTHPHTGRKLLNICPMFLNHIHQREDEAGDRLLRELVSHVTRPEFSYHHQWQQNDMILWDNWRMMHCAPGIRPGDQRLIHRTTIIDHNVLGRAAA